MHTRSQVPNVLTCENMCETTCHKVQKTNSWGKIIKWAFLNIFRKSELLHISNFAMILEHNFDRYVASEECAFLSSYLLQSAVRRC